MVVYVAVIWCYWRGCVCLVVAVCLFGWWLFVCGSGRLRYALLGCCFFVRWWFVLFCDLLVFVLCRFVGLNCWCFDVSSWLFLVGAFLV